MIYDLRFTIGAAGRRVCRPSTGGASEGSPRRQPWVMRVNVTSPVGAKDFARLKIFSVAPAGAWDSSRLTHGLRRGLPSAAAPQLRHERRAPAQNIVTVGRFA